MLLLLDNLEQVIESAPELSRFSRAVRNLTLLVTSRELLRIQGEVEYPVPPLAEQEAVALSACARSSSPPRRSRSCAPAWDSLPPRG
jgi:predicted ATPase